jgi:hypothetical protein
MKTYLEKNKSLGEKTIDEYCEFIAVKRLIDKDPNVEDHLKSVIGSITICQKQHIAQKILQCVNKISDIINHQEKEKFADYYSKFTQIGFENYPKDKIIKAINENIPDMVYSSDLPEEKYLEMKPKLNIEFAKLASFIRRREKMEASKNNSR